MRLRASATDAAEQTLPSDRAIEIMKQDLKGIVPVGVMAGAMGTDATAIGMNEPPILEIYTGSGVVNADTPFGDIQKIDYSLQMPTNRVSYPGRDLVRGVTRNLACHHSSGCRNRQSLLQGVQNLQFSYYGRHELRNGRLGAPRCPTFPWRSRSRLILRWPRVPGNTSRR